MLDHAVSREPRRKYATVQWAATTINIRSSSIDKGNTMTTTESVIVVTQDTASEIGTRSTIPAHLEAIRQTAAFVTLTECSLCHSLQPCIASATAYKCMDFRSCLIRQLENRNPTPPMRISDREIAALIEAYDRLCGENERLARIVELAAVYAQASEAFSTNRPTLERAQDMNHASDKLIAAVKGDK